MKNRIAYEISSEMAEHTEIFRHSLDAHTILQRLCETENDPDQAIQYLNSPSSRGFLLNFSLMPMPRKDILALMEIFKANCQLHGYTLYMSDSYEIGLDKFVRHYLKPARKYLKNVPIDQLFGNVIIEYSYTESGNSNRLKVTATNYPGRNYTSNKSLSELLQMITRI